MQSNVLTLKCLRPHSSTHVPLHLRYAITIILALTRAPHSQLFNKLCSTSIHCKSLFYIPLLLHLLSLCFIYIFCLCTYDLNNFYLSSRSCFFSFFSCSFCIVFFFFFFFLILFLSFFSHFLLLFLSLSLSPLFLSLSLSLLPFLLISLPIFYLLSSYPFCFSTHNDSFLLSLVLPFILSTISPDGSRALKRQDKTHRNLL